MNSNAVSNTRRPAVSRQARAPSSWWAVVSLALGAFGLVTAELLPISVLTPMASELGVSNGMMGQTITATAVVAAFAGPLLVLGAGRADRQKIVWALMAMLVASSLLSAYASNITTLFVARALLGFALGSFWAMMAALALRLVPSDKVPRAMSIILMGVSLATVFAAPSGVFLGERWGWRAIFIAASGIGVIALAIQILTLPRLPASSGAGLGSFKSVLSRRTVHAGLAVTMFAVVGHFAGFTFIRPFLEGVPHLDASLISLVLLAFGLAGFAGNVAGGTLSARSPAWAVIGSALLIAISALALSVFGATAVVAVVATAVWGFAFGAFPVSISMWNARAAPDHAEAAGALLSSMFQVAIATGAVVGGLVIDGMNSTGVIAFAALSAFVGAGVMFALRDKK
jgi:predicted MFS family arabinose efflux permease